ncbi:FAD-binding protein [Sphaerisporangium sp. TRM90804]|uniref:FAD-binding protein n=1 Tax=Sphaerisporangium sp. TRM90804 TaxID=3031113 RepID=UPI00244C6B7C|nr:FAD-binding protein [Sphaerisporangium sp. TRM90804]MDH2426550.1 FAD-binding protein [Sphaerisporangium sp. TRM90804]
MTAPRNWAGNIAFGCARMETPSSVAELQRLVARERRVRAIGTRHSFNDLADTPGVLVSLAGLPPETEVDSAARTVRVAAGMRYAELAPRLDREGYALPNLGSLPHISVAGACATATHGSGVRNGCLATAVSGLEMVTADGDLVTVDRRTGHFDGMVVGLGALGVVTALTLDLVPAFETRQRVYEGLPLEALDEHFAELTAAAYSVCLFTDWRAPRFTQVWINERTDEAETTVVKEPWFTAEPATVELHPVSGFSAASCTPQLGLPGRWFERLPHFRPDFEPSSAGDELHSEYMVPAGEAVNALRSLDRIRALIQPVLQICEVRTVAADELWMSPFYREDSVSIHFTWIADTEAVLPVVRLVEERLEPSRATPHWAKVFTTPPETLRSRYPRSPDFARLVREYDPAGTFGNAFVDRYLS